LAADAAAAAAAAAAAGAAAAASNAAARPSSSISPFGSGGNSPFAGFASMPMTPIDGVDFAGATF